MLVGLEGVGGGDGVENVILPYRSGCFDFHKASLDTLKSLIPKETGTMSLSIHLSFFSNISSIARNSLLSPKAFKNIYLII